MGVMAIVGTGLLFLVLNALCKRIDVGEDSPPRRYRWVANWGLITYWPDEAPFYGVLLGWLCHCCRLVHSAVLRKAWTPQRFHSSRFIPAVGSDSFVQV
mmetsp:Transcript_21602/g.37193  ORF Transcript_21602/g.37193 Transcript_21602/m.37193 type:complete len:99 (-) Transcript_21602:257-553(-)